MKSTILILGANGRLGFALTNYFIKKMNVIAVDKNFTKIKSIKNKNLIKIKINFEHPNGIKQFQKILLKNKNKISSIVYSLYPKTKSWGIRFEDLKNNNLKEHLFLQLGLPILILKEIYKTLKNTKNYLSIILFSSIQGVRAPKFNHYKNLNMSSPIEYSAAKAGLISITSYLEKYCSNNKIRINSISPGGIEDNQNKIFKSRYKKDCKSKGLLSATDIIGTVNFLSSSDSLYIRGQNIIIDDGWSL